MTMSDQLFHFKSYSMLISRLAVHPIAAKAEPGADVSSGTEAIKVAG